MPISRFILSGALEAKMKSGVALAAFAALAIVRVTAAYADGGPLGIDHRLSHDESGIWSRHNQLLFLNTMILGEVAGGLWEGGETRLGKTFWQSIDATLISAVTTTVMKPVFSRERPSEENNPDKWFQSGSHESFPSGEVATISAIVTPFVLEYRQDSPSVYLLELLPAYDAMARMKSQAHWQTDVLAAWGIGTAAGYYTHSRDRSFTLDVLPDGFRIGIKKQF